MEMTRREFLKVSGGLTFAFALPALSRAQSAGLKGNAWVTIDPDGTVTLLTSGAEMGQGSMTSLPLILADEMDADWSKVKLEFAPAEPQTYGYTYHNSRSMRIVGSRAVMYYYDDMRMAGAQVRKVLVANAAEKWGLEASSLRTEPGVVVAPSGQKLTYGEIAAFGKVPSPLPAVDKSELKDRSQFRYIGKAIPRRDIPLKVNGAAQFAIDVQLPGMVYATVRHSPVHGGSPQSWNEPKLKSMPGVIGNVRLPDGVAIVADTLPHAMAARKALEVQWKNGLAAGFDSEVALDETYRKVHDDPAAKIQIIDAKGDAKGAFASAAKTFKSDYFSDYGYHAQMEPLNAVARMSAAGDQVEVWEGTQDPGASRLAVAKALGVKPEQVTHHQCYMGGGFGRRTQGDCAAEAARIARDVKRPVKLVWTREEDLQYGMFRPQNYQCLQAALDKDGRVTGWSHCVVGDGGGLLQTGMRPHYYGVPNQHIEARGVSHGIRLKNWRAVGHVFNLFAMESFVDEMAVAQNMDPVRFRLEKMQATPRARVVFEKVVAMSDWKAPRPPGRALGISISERAGSLGAAVAEISLDRDKGAIKVHKVWFAADGGLVVQPEMARRSLESGILYGLSSVLHERVTVKNGVVQQSNFNDYPVMRMSDVPELIEIAFVERDAKPSGLGELGTPWVAAVANAFYRLAGKRLRHMPFTPERVQQLLRT